MRWIECKAQSNFRFTDAQLDTFPEFAKNGVGIWVMQRLEDYENLFKSPNWATFLDVAKVVYRNRYRKPKERSEKKQAGHGPEREIQTRIIEALEKDGWYVLETYGSLYQSGFPDLYACKKGFGQRWIEVKNPEGYCFTGAQLETFPRLMSEAVGIWILTSETQLHKLHEKPNWTEFL